MTAPLLASADPRSLQRATELLRRGEVVAIPTDTVYGLAADAQNAAAVDKLFEIKRRPTDRNIAVLVADTAAAESLVLFNDVARRLAARHWPGPLTLVLDCAEPEPQRRQSATLGVRVPDHAWCRRLASVPLAVTSANLHGGPTPATAQDVASLFGELSLVVDGGPLPGRASTVVDSTGPVPVVLREGPILL